MFAGASQTQTTHNWFVAGVIAACGLFTPFLCPKFKPQSDLALEKRAQPMHSLPSTPHNHTLYCYSSEALPRTSSLTRPPKLIAAVFFVAAAVFLVDSLNQVHLCFAHKHTGQRNWLSHTACIAWDTCRVAAAQTRAVALTTNDEQLRNPGASSQQQQQPCRGASSS